MQHLDLSLGFSEGTQAIALQQFHQRFFRVSVWAKKR
jgi:hypothetical protein